MQKSIIRAVVQIKHMEPIFLKIKLIPRVGEYLQVYTNIESGTENDTDSIPFYKVTQVVHLCEVPEEETQVTLENKHDVKIFAKKTDKKFD